MKVAWIFLMIYLLASFSWAQIEGRSLTDVAKIKVPLSESQWTVFLVFQKDCSACRKQVQDLNCLKQPIFLVGAFSTESELRQEYRKLATKKPAFYGDREVLKRLDINEKLTPQIVLLKKGKSQKLLGLTDCKEIQKRVTQEGALG